MRKKERERDKKQSRVVRCCDVIFFLTVNLLDEDKKSRFGNALRAFSLDSAGGNAMAETYFILFFFQMIFFSFPTHFNLIIFLSPLVPLCLVFQTTKTNSFFFFNLKHTRILELALE